MNKCKCISNKRLVIEVMEAIIGIIIMSILAYILYSLIKPEIAKSTDQITSSALTCITEQKPITKEDVKLEIVKQALEADVNIYTALRIAKAESNYNHLVKNKNSSASGVFQITKSTFLEGIKKMKVDWVESDVFDYKKNIEMSIWMMKKGEYWRWNASKKSWNK